MVDIQSATVELSRGKKKEEERKKETGQQDKNIMSASATQGGHKNEKQQLTSMNIL